VNFTSQAISGNSFTMELAGVVDHRVCTDSNSVSSVPLIVVHVVISSRTTTSSTTKTISTRFHAFVGLRTAENG
jgi:hypothetical protein